MFIAVFLFVGCAVLDTHQAKLDQKQLRDVLMDYTEDQILDNLIRARNGLPIVHYDLSHITAAVTSKLIPTVGVGRMVTDVQTRTPTTTTVTGTVTNTITKTVSVVGGLVDTVAKPFNFNVGAERDNAIGVEATPVLDKPEIYAAYINFLNIDITHEQPEKATANVTKKTTVTAEPTTVTTTTTAPSPSPSITTEIKHSEKATTTTTEEAPKPARIGNLNFEREGTRSLARSPTRPAATEVLVGPKRWRDGLYYWVPKRYAPQFLELCLATVARGGAAAKSGEQKALEESNALQRQRNLLGPQ
jgi:hypothetical protein